MSSIHITYAAQRVYVPSTEDDIYGTPQILQKCFVGFQDGDGGDVCYLMQMVKTSNTYSRLNQQKVTLHHGTLVDTLFSGTRHRIARNWQYKNSINLTCLDYLPGNGSNQQHQWSWIPTSGSQIMYVPFGENNPTVVYTNTDSLGHYEIYNNTLEGYKYIVFNNKSVTVRTGGTPTGQFDQVSQFAEHLPIETLNKNFSALTVFVPGWLYTDTFRLGTHGTWADGTRADSLVYVSSCAHSSIAFPTPVAAEGYEFAGWRSTSTGIIYRLTDKPVPSQDEAFDAVFTNDTTPLPAPPVITTDTTRYAEGTEFYFAFLKGGRDISNVAGDGARDNYIRVLCRQQTQITLTAPDGTSQTYTIPANSYLEINHLLHWQDRAYHLVASLPVVVEACNHQKLLQDVSSIAPVPAAGTSYVVHTIKSSLAEVAVIATEDNTSLTITKGAETQQYSIRKGGLSLNKGEVCYLQSLDTDLSDMGQGTNYGALSGTRIEANHPVVVIEGCAATPYVGYPLNISYGASDHQCSQAYSAEWMGTEFVVLGDESRGTNFAEITTLTPNTQITTPSQVVTIQPGEVFRMAVNHRQATYIQSSQPVSCVLFLCGMPNLDGDPSQVRIYPLSHASDYSQFTCNRISPPNSFGTKDIAKLPIHVLHLVCPSNQLETMHLNGQSLSGWKPVPNLPNWSYLIKIIPSDSTIVHHLANTEGVFTGYISALTITESYAAHLPKMKYWQIADTLRDTICQGEQYTWQSQSYSETGIYTFSNKNDYGIDSLSVLDLFVKDCSCDTTYSFTDTTFIYDSLQVHPFVWFEKEYTDPGVYADTLINGNAQGCDSIGRLLLRVIYKDSLYACGDEQVTFRTPWGEYDSQPDCECLTGYPLQTSDGEWLVDASLCVNRLYTDTVREDTVLCFGTSMEWHGITIDQTHEYEFHEPFKRLLTCDSVVYYLNATIKDEPTDHPTTTSVCAGTSYTWTTYHDSIITAPGIYYDTLWTDHGCYSDTYILTLTHKAHSIGDTTAYICYGDLPYLWHGKSLTESCDTSWTTINSAGCDSVVKLHLFVGPEPKKDLADTTICYSDRIDWHGQTINTEGTYYDTARVTMGNSLRCDSIWYELAVTIQKSDTTPSNISICAGSEYVWKRVGKPDSVIRKAGEYWDTVRYVQTGCDSMIYHLTLQVEDINRDSVSAETCANTPYLWRGQSLTAEGIYRDTAKAKTVTECDTVYTLRLTINQPTIGDTIVMACDSFTWHGVTYTESTNTATWTTTNIAGCDSIVTLHLTINHASSSETTISICPEELPYTWNGKDYTAEGDYTYQTINAAGCDSTATLHLKVIQCCPDTIMRRTKLSICDTLMPYTWVTWREVVVEKTGSFADTLRNDLGCDSIIYTLTLDTFHCCAPLMAAIDVPDYICADAPYLPIEVKLLSGECASYSLHFMNPTLNKMPFRDTTITIDVQYASDEPFILDIPVPDDPDDSTHYVRPDDNYKVSLTLYDRCGNSIIFGDSIFSVYYPSWVTDQHWDDVIALLNDRYNGGYTFSSVQWLRDGEELAGEDGLYIYLPHELWTNPSHQYQSYFYQALLTRTDDGKTLPTCPLEPWHIDNTNVLSDPYVSVTPTLVPKENPVVHVMTNTEGTYWIYDPAGKLLQTADYEPCEHSAFDIRLYCVQTMYILVFTPRNEKNPLQHKYSVVKVLVE